MSEPFFTQHTAVGAGQIHKLTDVFTQTKGKLQKHRLGYFPLKKVAGRIIRVCDSGLRAGLREDLPQLAVCLVALDALLKELDWHAKQAVELCKETSAILCERVFESTGHRVPWRSDALDAQAVCSAYGKDFDEFVRFYNCDLSDPEDFERDGETLWIRQAEAMRLVQWCDVDFMLQVSSIVSHNLFRAPDRERHQASLAQRCPEIYRLMFPNVPADGEDFDTDGDA